jgi:type VI secretion system protein ImpM
MLPDPPMGFFGKLPARGDFLRVGLPRSFTDPLDLWLQTALAMSRASLGDRWGTVWAAASIWRFALPPGACGPSPAIGLMMPSWDSVGRSFPLVFARLSLPDDPAAAAFLAAAACAGQAAIVAGLAPDAVLAMLRQPHAATLELPGTWWTALPTPDAFLATLEAISEIS